MRERREQRAPRQAGAAVAAPEHHQAGQSEHTEDDAAASRVCAQSRPNCQVKYCQKLLIWASKVRLSLEDRRLAVLRPVEHVVQCLAEEADRLAFVDGGELAGAHRQVEVVERDADDDGDARRRR